MYQVRCQDTRDESDHMIDCLKAAIKVPEIQFLHICNISSLTYGTSPVVHYYYCHSCCMAIMPPDLLLQSQRPIQIQFN